MGNRVSFAVRGSTAAHVIAGLLLCGSVAVPAAAQDVSALTTERVDEKRVTVDLDGVPLTQALREIARSAGLNPAYNEATLPHAWRVTLHVRQALVSEAFQEALRGTALVAQVRATGDVFITRSGAAVDGQRVDGAISGRVVDSATGKGIAKATVHVQGTMLSVISGDSGRFVVTKVPAAAYTLRVTALGFRPTEQRVVVKDGGSVTVRVVMAASATLLSGVVTTATGKQERIRIGNDITSINVDSVMKVAPITSVTSLLEGRVPGLTVIHTSGTPGDPARLRLRGAASIEGSNDPIVIIDGVRAYYGDASTQNNNTQSSTLTRYARPSPLDQLDPNTIETIEVSKGPSASALYGSDAANGVIVITTKRGRPGPTHWSLTGNLGQSKIAGAYPTITYGFGHTQSGSGPSGTNLGIQCALGYIPGLSTLCIMDSTVTYQALNDPRYNPLGTGQDGSLSGTVSGGVQNLQYSLTGSGSTDQGPVRLPTASAEQYVEYAKQPVPSWMKRPDHYTTWSGSGLVTATLSPAMRITLTSRSSTSDQQRSSIGTSGVSQLIGIFVDTTLLGESSLLTGFAEKITADTKTTSNSGQFDWDVFSWMHANVVGGVDQQRGRDISYLPAGLPVQAGSGDSTGAYSLGQQEGDVISGTLGTVSTIPLPFHRQMRFATGFNAQKTSYTSSSLWTHGIPVGVTTPTSFVNTNTTVTEQSSANATYGWYLEPEIDLFPRLFFSPGIRIDGGSSTGIRAGTTGFPKMSLAWVALDNDGVNDHPWRRWIDQLRLRGSYGYAGVQPNPSSRLRLVSQSSVILNGGTTLLPGASIASLGNTELRPERSVELETGFDADLFGDRLELTATYYHKKRIDAIMASSVAASVGGGVGTGVFSAVNMSTYYQNVGEIRNDGLEFTLNLRLLQSDQLNWDVNASASSNTNKLVSFSDTYNASPGGVASKLVLGYPIDGLWVSSIAGYADLNGNGVIDPSEVFLTDSSSYIGTQNPPQIGSIGTNLAVLNGRLSFNAMFTYQHGGTQYNTLALTLLRSAALQPDATLREQAIYVASATYAGSGTLRPGTRYLYQSADLVRWQSASVTYTLPTSIARMLHGRSTSLSLQGDNLWLHTRYRGKDPNVNSSLYSEGVQDSGQIPMPRTFVLRVNLTN